VNHKSGKIKSRKERSTQNSGRKKKERELTRDRTKALSQRPQGGEETHKHGEEDRKGRERKRGKCGLKNLR